MTLKEFIEKTGSKEQASADLGICVQTLTNWIKGKTKPRNKIYIKILKENNIEV